MLVPALILLLSNKINRETLSQCVSESMQVRRKPHGSTYIDYIINIALNLSINESLVPSVVCIFHLLTDVCDEVFVIIIYKLFNLFEIIVNKFLAEKDTHNQRLTEIFMEGFVRHMKRSVNVLILIVKKRRSSGVLRRLKSNLTVHLKLLLIFWTNSKDFVR